MANKGRKQNHESWSKWTSRSLGGLVCLRMNKESENSSEQKIKNEIEREKSFLTNGGILLEDLIASSNGKCNPIRNFSAEELIRATNNFDKHHVIERCHLLPDDDRIIVNRLKANRLIVDELDEFELDELNELDELDELDTVTYYRGSLDGRTIIVKKYFASSIPKDRVRSLAIRDIVIATQMSNHKNVLKLIGCCLEFYIPALVHEYASNGALNDRGGCRRIKILPWKMRLQIAKKLANALTYLHTALSRPVVHRNISPSSIFLDHNFVPKFCNFSISITIPPEQSHASDDVDKVHLYSDPEFTKNGSVTLKSDVYSFGVLLLVFLTRQEASKVLQATKLVDRNILTKGGGDRQAQLVEAFLALADRYILWKGEGDRQVQQVEAFLSLMDRNLLREGGGDRQVQQVEAFLALALACTRKEGEARPDMIEVAKELMRIEKLIIKE